MSEVEKMAARTIIDAVCEGDHHRRLIKSPRLGTGWYDEYGTAWQDDQIESWSVLDAPGIPALSQPTPTAEADDVELCDCGEPAAVCAAKRAMPVAPPSIADMVPGTTITSICPRCGGSGCVGLADCRLCAGTGVVSNPDPSTIRDLTPPAVTP